ncbi:Electrogenic sodium bicarbonate cotransporter 1 [Trichinella zimbabwensis]|uniref:Electrogenic sodium bicarbonate cotransporter 1 n=1 Tax=Trichinella zimbabwensis TaxID=268475 RepID=A0A0V1HTI1_9BILA|nr:Electrogenic sodium bicarbonate cotransporter 1 [Trichinella zimbabwensis]
MQSNRMRIKLGYGQVYLFNVLVHFTNQTPVFVSFSFYPAITCDFKSTVPMITSENVNFIDNRRHQHRHQHRHKHKGIYGETEKHEQQSCPYLFCELLELDAEISGKKCCWQEIARHAVFDQWIKYEETVAASRARWSKPHIPLLNQHSLHSLKIHLTRGIFLPNCEAITFNDVIDIIINEWKKNNLLQSPNDRMIKDLFLFPKCHVSSKPLGFRNCMQPLKSDSYEFDHHGEEYPSIEPLSKSEQKSIVYNKTLHEKLPSDTCAAVMFVGKSRFVNKPVSAFVRLKLASHMPSVCEINLPVSYIFVLLAPEYHANDLAHIGRCLASLLTDPAYVKHFRTANSGNELAESIDAFMEKALIIPPNKWPYEVKLHAEKVQLIDEISNNRKDSNEKHKGDLEGLCYTGRIFGGLVEDVKRRLWFYKDDFMDAFVDFSAMSQVLASAMFIFLTNLANIIIFGAVMGHMLDNQMGVIECILSGCISGIAFSLFSGQPMWGWNFLASRGWLSFWSSLIILLFVATDGSFLVAYITRFTEDLFATLIAIIFIVESVQSMVKIAVENPITYEPDEIFKEPPCHCVMKRATNETTVHIVQNITSKGGECNLLGGVPEGLRCSFHPDVFLFSFVLFISAFLIMLGFKLLKNSNLFPKRIRELLTNFSALISIAVTTIVKEFVGLKVPELVVPSKFQPSFERSWYVDWTNVQHWWIGLICFLPAILLTILLVMDQQITAVIINRKENKLKKGYGYHLDLLVISVLMLICGLFGLPFFVASTVLSIGHVQSLRMESPSRAPGDKPIFTGIREQRVSSFLAHLLIGISLFLTMLVQMVPLPALLGVFLYLGIACMEDQQFVHRILLFFSPVKHQPEFAFLQSVPLLRVHFYTAIQIAAFLLLCIVKYTKEISMLFPLMLFFMVLLRKLLSRLFTVRELRALDDQLPTWSELTGCHSH